MISNILLEEKYRAQRRLSEQAREGQREYLQVVADEVANLFRARGWPLRYASRSGGVMAQVREDHAKYGTPAPGEPIA